MSTTKNNADYGAVPGLGSADANAANNKKAVKIPEGIDEQAPVIARHSAVIDAPLEVLWGLHTNIDAWPSWQTDIESAHLMGPFAPGSTFAWTASGLQIDSNIYRVEPGCYTLWGGPAHGITGIHEWRFTPVPDGVRVDTIESWSGEPVEVNPEEMQAALDESLVLWLERLAVAAGLLSARFVNDRLRAWEEGSTRWRS